MARNGGAVLKTPQDAANYFRDWLADIATLQGVRAINDRVELIPRAAAMRRAEARGLSGDGGRGGQARRDLRPRPPGTVVRAANGLVPFLNATVQSGAQVKRLFASTQRGGVDHDRDAGAAMLLAEGGTALTPTARRRTTTCRSPSRTAALWSCPRGQGPTSAASARCTGVILTASRRRSWW